MSVINLLLTIILVTLIAKTPEIGALIGRLPGVDQSYLEQLRAEKQKRIELENAVAALEERLAAVNAGSSTKDLPTFNYTGDEVFKIINDYRRRANVGELALDPNLCYLASLRLSQLLSLGKLDAHQGFIDFDPTAKFKYERVGENLAYGYTSADAVVEAWEKSPGHNLTLKDPVNTLGCVAANRGFAVFIAGREH